MRLPPILCLSAVIACSPAEAGAWTQDKGQTQIIISTTVSEAWDQFGPVPTPKGFYFNKTFIQSSLEYGLSDTLTLLAAPEFVSARWGSASQAAIKAPDTAVETGLRLRLFSGAGVLSIQGTVRTAGAFDLYIADPTSSGPAKLISGKAVEARLLYGTNFKLFGCSGYTDLEAAERWISRPRPNEIVVDASSGLWLTKKTLVLLQSFNTLSQGRTSQPYRADKLEISLVQNLVKEWSLQAGGFVSPFGRDTIVERGITLSIWRRF
jgi:hypothetical protein